MLNYPSNWFCNSRAFPRSWYTRITTVALSLPPGTHVALSLPPGTHASRHFEHLSKEQWLHPQFPYPACGNQPNSLILCSWNSFILLVHDSLSACRMSGTISDSSADSTPRQHVQCPRRVSMSTSGDALESPLWIIVPNKLSLSLPHALYFSPCLSACFFKSVPSISSSACLHRHPLGSPVVSTIAISGPWWAQANVIKGSLRDKLGSTEMMCRARR